MKLDPESTKTAGGPTGSGLPSIILPELPEGNPQLTPISIP